MRIPRITSHWELTACINDESEVGSARNVSSRRQSRHVDLSINRSTCACVEMDDNRDKEQESSPVTLAAAAGDDSPTAIARLYTCVARRGTMRSERLSSDSVHSAINPAN